MFKRILVGFDGSNNARQALRTGVALASDVRGEAVVAILVPSGHGETEEERRAAFEAEAAPLEAMARDELDAVTRGVTKTTVHVWQSDRPAADLAHHLEERGFDLLVIGRHGRDRAVHGGLGKVARELAEKVGGPLLLVGGRLGGG